MEEYINNDTCFHNDIYEVFKDAIKCPLCHNIFINPMMCMKCQNVYCQKCIDDFAKKSEKCPEGCEEPDYKKSIIKCDILSKLQFICKFCKSQIFYNDVQNHYENCKLKNPLSQNSNKESMRKTLGGKLEKISTDDINKYKKKGNDVRLITGN